ncbi:neurofilament heavy polypeptide isoform X2 [Anabrus simplex]|uniref:neurofilament heavy polypeptide isoform X2 n=1 Tax=Anabrus simplex TaxID=316456 RepID=UPI0035A3631B
MEISDLSGDKIMEAPSVVTIADDTELMDADLESLTSAYSDKCMEIEAAALDTVCGLQVPLLYPLKALTRGDCWLLMNKYQERFNVLEKAVFLTGLTDYVTCACNNTEMYDAFRKNSCKNSIPSLLKRLQSHWCRFFLRLRKGDMSIAQMTSLLNLLKQSIARLAENQRAFFTGALAIGEKALIKLTETPLQGLKVKQEKVTAAQGIKPKQEKVTAAQGIKPKQENVSTNKHLQKNKPTKNKVSVEKNASHKKEEIKENLNEGTKTVKTGKTKPIKPVLINKQKSFSKLKNSNSPKKSQPASDVRKGEEVPVLQTMNKSNEIGKLDQERLKKRKSASTLEKYILKPCENKMPLPIAQPDIQVVDIKDDDGDSIIADKGSELNTKPENLVLDGPSHVSKLDQSSESKLDKDRGYLANGKINAFKLMMEPKRPRIEEKKPESVKINAFKLLMQAKRPRLNEGVSPCKVHAKLPTGRSKLKKIPQVKCK